MLADLHGAGSQLRSEFWHPSKPKRLPSLPCVLTILIGGTAATGRWGLHAFSGVTELPSVSPPPKILTTDPKGEVKITSVSLGGERFIAQQLKPGSW
jgi:hypothetical protein